MNTRPLRPCINCGDLVNRDAVDRLISALERWALAIEVRRDPELSGVAWEIRMAAVDLRDQKVPGRPS